jgi:hypothetical protein
MEAEDEQLQLEGARGMWELSINKPHHAEMQACHLRLLVKHLQSANIEVWEQDALLHTTVGWKQTSTAAAAGKSGISTISSSRTAARPSTAVAIYWLHCWALPLWIVTSNLCSAG